MWPFTKKEVVAEPPRRPYPVTPGQRFKWLGVDMIVTSTAIEWFDEDAIRFVEASYVNGRGDIKSLKFWPHEWDALEAELTAQRPDMSWLETCREYVAAGQLIEAVKLYRNKSGSTLKAASDICKAMK